MLLSYMNKKEFLKFNTTGSGIRLRCNNIYKTNLISIDYIDIVLQDFSYLFTI